MATPRWRRGTDDLVPLVVMAVPMLWWSLSGGPGHVGEVIVVFAAVGLAVVLKRVAPTPWEDLALAPPVVALLVEVSSLSLTAASLLFAAVAGVGLLLWAGTSPTSGVTVGQQLEPALVPALAVAVAAAVLFFLPGGTGGQVGLAALVLVGVLGLSAWLYLRSAAEAVAAQSTS